MTVKADMPPAHGAATPNSSAPPDPVDAYWLLRLNTAKEAFEKNNYRVSIVDSPEAAKHLVLNKILPELKPRSLSFGGSRTVERSGLVHALLAQNSMSVINTVDYSLPPEEMLERRRQALLVDLFFASANAATMDGRLALLDGLGNRTAAVQFGPRNVVLFISRNKMVENIADAVERTRKIAAPMNAIRLNRKTPCANTGKCMDCKSPERICNTWTILEKCAFKDRIHLVLINADAGF